MEQQKVFVVEDDRMYSFMLDRQLSQIANFSTLTLSSGEECIEKLDEEPDIILMDYNMPGMNGLETLIKIRQQNEEVVVIFLSADDDPELIKRCKEAGADEFIVKDPHAAENVYRTVMKVLEEDSGRSSHFLGNLFKRKK